MHAVCLLLVVGLLAGCTNPPTSADATMATQYVTMKVIEGSKQPARTAAQIARLAQFTSIEAATVTTQQELLGVLAQQPWYAGLDASDKTLLTYMVQRAFSASPVAGAVPQIDLARAYLKQMGDAAVLWQSMQPPAG